MHVQRLLFIRHQAAAASDRAQGVIINIASTFDGTPGPDRRPRERDRQDCGQGHLDDAAAAAAVVRRLDGGRVVRAEALHVVVGGGRGLLGRGRRRHDLYSLRHHFFQSACRRRVLSRGGVQVILCCECDETCCACVLGRGTDRHSILYLYTGRGSRRAPPNFCVQSPIRSEHETFVRVVFVHVRFYMGIGSRVILNLGAEKGGFSSLFRCLLLGSKVSSTRTLATPQTARASSSSVVWPWIKKIRPSLLTSTIVALACQPSST